MKDVFADIIIPLLAAFIGGGMTLFGVKQTIRHENELRQEDYRRSQKQNAKPLLINRGF